VLGFIGLPVLFFPAQAVEFNRDIRPILSDRCFACHGPDAPAKNIQRRLDSEAGMLASIGGRQAVVPGQPDKSELIRRVTSENRALRMPPLHSGLGLTGREISLFRQWVEQGAKWQKHWAFVTPTRPETPPVTNQAWPRNPIDSFVLARLEREGLKPSPEAAKTTLIRRVTLDLTGLPPTIPEIDAFLSDTSPNAYEKLVDRLLASPRYAERLAIRWLDVARYADTNGYQTDAERSMWRWRDWVIDAFEKNKPFDQFTVEQIAGDLLPNSTLDQKIATGFNRNHRGNGEGGIIPEEYAVEYVADRIETLSAVWLGLTMGCARCHNHKYDPVSQKEYYQLFAYFNNIAERGRYFKFGNTPPVLPAPLPLQQEKLKELDEKIRAAASGFQALQPAYRKARNDWERSLTQPADWFVTRGLAAHFALEPESKTGLTYAPGRYGQGLRLDGKSFFDAGKPADFGFYDSFTLAAWINPSSPTGAVVTRAKDQSEEAGLGIYLQDRKVQVNLVLRWLDDCLRVETESPVELHQWTHVAATYDGSREAGGIHVYINGQPARLKVVVDELNQNFRVAEPWRIGAGNGMRFEGLIDEVRIYKRALTASEAAMLALTRRLDELAAMPPAARTAEQSEKLRLAFLEDHAPPEIRQSWSRLQELSDARRQYVGSFPTVMVMEEMTPPRDAFLLIRGAYDKPGEKVQRGVPAVFPPAPAGLPANRLGLARWMVDPANPLTARVTVNRFWQMYFGVGIVKTTEDFGAQGEWPSHLDLLDWLATEFIRTGWNVKAMQKTIVMSAAYRQSSRTPPALLERDPENRLLARGPRVRLPAEMVRDQALSISGLLVEKQGGPSVKPYQPEGLWRELTGGEDYKRDTGEKLYRRSLYTFWKRTAPPPMMMNFDSPSRETCVVRESRTNTPLQALNLMNDVTFLEAARKMAERMMREGGQSPDERIAYGFRLAMGRRPNPQEAAVLLDGFRYQLDYYRTAPAAAKKLLSQGESGRDETLDPSELAAYSTVASLILNLDETVTRQ
jgi:hypothetical protein